MTTLIDLKTYQNLVYKIKSEIEGLTFLVQKETVSTYWEIGKFISQYLLESESRAEYGDNLYIRLAQDVGINVSSLERSVLFFKAYPISAPGPELSWSHYRSLMRIEDDSQRLKITQLAIKNNWNSKELARYIQELRGERNLAQKNPNPCTTRCFPRKALHVQNCRSGFS